MWGLTSGLAYNVEHAKSLDRVVTLISSTDYLSVRSRFSKIDNSMTQVL